MAAYRLMLQKKYFTTFINQFFFNAMKKLCLYLTTLLLLIGCGRQEQTYRIATYNIRLDIPHIDTGNKWVDRCPHVANLMSHYDFDVMGTQEGFYNQLNDLKMGLPQYSYYGRGRDDGEQKGETSAIFYKNEKFALLDSGDFWFSETPEKPGLGWDAHYPRICSWVKLQDKSKGNSFYVFCLHLDHMGKIAREEGCRLIQEKINAIAGSEPTMLMGDFNFERESSLYQILAASPTLTDCYTQVDAPYTHGNGSYNGFGDALQDTSIIDHIFVTRHFSPTSYTLITDSYKGKFPSDHFPVMVALSVQ